MASCAPRPTGVSARRTPRSGHGRPTGHRAAFRGAVWLLFVLFAGAGCTERKALPLPDRIVLFSMDTVRADSAYDPQVAPELAAIASKGLRFDRAYAAANYTLPSHMSMFTGLDPAEHGVVRMFTRLSPEVPTLAEALAAAGYPGEADHEGVFVAARFGFDRGFVRSREHGRRAVVGRDLPEVLRAIAVWPGRSFHFLHTYAAHYPYGGFARYRRNSPARGLPDDVAIARLRRRYPFASGRVARARASRELDAEARAMCALYNALAEGHEDKLGCATAPFVPFGVHGAADLEAVKRSYAERVREVDRAIGRLRAELEARGQWEGTLLVVTSDHGEAFYEHGLYQHDYVPFDEVMRIPLVVSYPRALRTGRRSDLLVSHIDVMPTLLSLARAPRPPGLAGRDLSPLLRGAAPAGGAGRTLFPALLWPAQKPQEALRRVVVQGRAKWIDGHPSYGAEGLLFDVVRDGAEKRDMRLAAPDEARRLEALAREHDAHMKLVPPLRIGTGEPVEAPFDAEAAEGAAAGPGGLSEAEQRRLRALGYLD